MTKNISNVEVSTDTFQAWLNITNQMATALRDEVVTVDGTVDGNVTVNGSIFSTAINVTTANAHTVNVTGNVYYSNTSFNHHKTVDKDYITSTRKDGDIYKYVVSVDGSGGDEFILESDSTDFDNANTKLRIANSIVWTDSVVGGSPGNAAIKNTGTSNGNVVEVGPGDKINVALLQTDAQIKTAYENNANTNEFTDAEKTKLSQLVVGGGGQFTYTEYEYTATEGQTVFSGNDDNTNFLDYTVGNIQISVDGLLLHPTDYTATDGSSITLTSGLDAGSEVHIFAFTTFEVANALDKSGGTMTGNLIVGTGGSALGKFNVFGGTDHTLTLDATASYVEIQSYNDPLYINRQGNDTILNTGGGNVGIGTTSTTEKLSLENSGANSTGIALNQTGTSGRDYRISSTGTGYGSAGNLIIYDATASAERMRINSSGQLQVGTTTLQTDAAVGARRNGDCFEWGHTNTAGYTSALGVEEVSGFQNITLFCTKGSVGNSYKTSGFPGNVIVADTLGDLHIKKVPVASADGQTPLDLISFVSYGQQIHADTTENKVLEIGTGRAGDGWSFIDLIGDATYSDYGMRVVRKGGVNSDSAIEHRGTGNLQITANDAGGVIISTNGSGRLEVDSAGNVEIGSYSATGASQGRVFNNDGSETKSSVTTTSNAWHLQFINPNGSVGSVYTNGSSTIYATTSDYRLKENVVAISDGIARLKQLKPKRLNFIADPSTIIDSFLAHEVQEVVPEAVSGEKDAVDVDGDPIVQQMDASKLIPLLTAALQEAVSKIEDLEERVTELENA